MQIHLLSVHSANICLEIRRDLGTNYALCSNYQCFLLNMLIEGYYHYQSWISDWQKSLIGAQIKHFPCDNINQCEMIIINGIRINKLKRVVLYPINPAEYNYNKLNFNTVSCIFIIPPQYFIICFGPSE